MSTHVRAVAAAVQRRVATAGVLCLMVLLGTVCFLTSGATSPQRQQNAAECRILDVSSEGVSVLSEDGVRAAGLTGGRVVHATVLLVPGPTTQTFILGSQCGRIEVLASMPRLRAQPLSAIPPAYVDLFRASSLAREPHGVLTGRFTSSPLEEDPSGDGDATLDAKLWSGSVVSIPADAFVQRTSGSMVKLAVYLAPSDECVGTYHAIEIGEEQRVSSHRQSAPPCTSAWIAPWSIRERALTRRPVRRTPLVNRTEPPVSAFSEGLHAVVYTNKNVKRAEHVTPVPGYLRYGAYALRLRQEQTHRTQSRGSENVDKQWIHVPRRPAAFSHVVRNRLGELSARRAVATSQPSLDAAIVMAGVPPTAALRLVEVACEGRPVGFSIDGYTIDPFEPLRSVSVPTKLRVVSIAVNGDRVGVHHLTTRNHEPTRGTGGRNSGVKFERGRVNYVVVTLHAGTEAELQKSLPPQLRISPPPGHVIVKQGVHFTRADAWVYYYQPVGNLQFGFLHFYNSSDGTANTGVSKIDQFTFEVTVPRTLHSVSWSLPVESVPMKPKLFLQADPSGDHAVKVYIRLPHGVGIRTLHLSLSHVMPPELVTWGSATVQVFSQELPEDSAVTSVYMTGFPSPDPDPEPPTRKFYNPKQWTPFDAPDADARLANMCVGDNEWRVLHCELGSVLQALYGVDEDPTSTFALKNTLIRDHMVVVTVSLSVPPYVRKASAVKALVTADGGVRQRQSINIGPGVHGAVQGASREPFQDEGNFPAKFPPHQSASQTKRRPGGSSRNRGLEDGEDYEDGAEFDSVVGKPRSHKYRPGHIERTHHPAQHEDSLIGDDGHPFDSRFDPAAVPRAGPLETRLYDDDEFDVDLSAEEDRTLRNQQEPAPQKRAHWDHDTKPPEASEVLQQMSQAEYARFLAERRRDRDLLVSLLAPWLPGSVVAAAEEWVSAKSALELVLGVLLGIQFVVTAVSIGIGGVYHLHWHTIERRLRAEERVKIAHRDPVRRWKYERLDSGKPGSRNQYSDLPKHVPRQGDVGRFARSFASVHSVLSFVCPCSPSCRSLHASAAVSQLLVTIAVLLLTVRSNSIVLTYAAPLVAGFVFRRATELFLHGMQPVRGNLVAFCWSAVLVILCAVRLKSGGHRNSAGLSTDVLSVVPTIVLADSFVLHTIFATAVALAGAPG
jgi:uncharacterized membrane protein (UPF0136 family)